MTTRKDREKAKRRRVDPKEWSKKQRGGEGGSCVKLPDGVEAYKLTPGTNKLDFLPYIVGKNNPNCDEGLEHYERTYSVHWLPTPNGNRSYACRKACFGKRCAVCDWLQTKGGSSDPELVKAVRAKTRHIWLVNDKPGETKKVKVKILDTSHQNKGMGFAELMGDALDLLDDGVFPFSLEDGYTAYIKVSEQSMGDGKKYNAATRIDLRPHPYNYPESLMEELPCLDDCIVDPGYDEVKKLIDPDTEDDDDKPVSSKPQAKGKKEEPEEEEDEDDDDSDEDDSDDDEDETPAKGKKGKEKTAHELKLKVKDIVEHEEYGECEITHISKDGTSLKIETEKGKVYPGIAPSDVTKVKTADKDDEDEEEDEDETPAKGKEDKDADDEDDEEDDDSDEDDSDEDDDDSDDDDEPPAKKKGKRK